MDVGGILAITLTVIPITIIFWVFFFKTVKVVRHAEVMIVERFGKYRKTLRAGIHFLVPIADSPRKINWRYVNCTGKQAPTVKNVVTDRVDMREHVINFGKQHVITKDTVEIQIDALVYFEVVDPKLAVYRIQNLPDAVELLTQATLRNIIASMTLDDTFSSRERINDILLSQVKPDAERWGVSIQRVEVMEIMPPNDIRAAMESQITAERERRATVLTADGQRESSIVRSRGDAAKLILTAEGDKTSNIQRAKGDAEAKLTIANSETTALKVLRKSLENSYVQATAYLVAVQYLNALQSMTFKSAGSTVHLVPQTTVDVIGQFTN